MLHIVALCLLPNHSLSDIEYNSLNIFLLVRDISFENSDHVTVCRVEQTNVVRLVSESSAKQEKKMVPLVP